MRFIYVHRLPWYLQVSRARDVIEVPISGDLDINGWELRKALGLMKKGNATLIEWLDSPVVYRICESYRLAYLSHNSDPAVDADVRKVLNFYHQVLNTFAFG